MKCVEGIFDIKTVTRAKIVLEEKLINDRSPDTNVMRTDKDANRIPQPEKWSNFCLCYEEKFLERYVL